MSSNGSTRMAYELKKLKEKLSIVLANTGGIDNSQTFIIPKDIRSNIGVLTNDANHVGYNNTATNTSLISTGFPYFTTMESRDLIKMPLNMYRTYIAKSTAHMLANIATSISDANDCIVFAPSLDDRLLGLTLEQSKMNILEILRVLKENKKTVISIACLPSFTGVLTTAQLADHKALNKWMATDLVKVYGELVVNPWPKLADTNGIIASNFASTKDILTPAGARIVSNQVLALLSRLVRKSNNRLLSNVAFSDLCVVGSLGDNPLLTGSVTTDISGLTLGANSVIPTNYSLVGNNCAGLTVTSSKVVKPEGGYGEELLLNIVGTPTAASANIVFANINTLSGRTYTNAAGTTGVSTLSANDLIKAVTGISISGSALTGFIDAALELNYTKSATDYVLAHGLNNGFALFTEKLSGTKETPILKLDGTETNVKQRLVMHFKQNVPVNMTIKISQFGTRKMIQ